MLIRIRSLKSMRRGCLRILVGVFILSQVCAPLMAGEGVAVPQAALLVKFKPGISSDMARDILRRHAATEFTPLSRAKDAGPAPMDRWWIVRFAASTDLRKAAAAVRAEPAVEVVEVEGSYRISPK